MAPATICVTVCSHRVLTPCAHKARKSPNTLETAEVICALILDLGACSTIKCVSGMTRQPESLRTCLLLLPFGKIAVGCWVARLLAHVRLLHGTDRLITGAFLDPRHCSVNLPLHTQRILPCHRSVCSFCCSPSCHPSCRFLLKQVEGKVEARGWW